jgi:hypothetical protein
VKRRLLSYAADTAVHPAIQSPAKPVSHVHREAYDSDAKSDRRAHDPNRIFRPPGGNRAPAEDGGSWPRTCRKKPASFIVLAAADPETANLSRGIPSLESSYQLTNLNSEQVAAITRQARSRRYCRKSSAASSIKEPGDEPEARSNRASRNGSNHEGPGALVREHESPERQQKKRVAAALAHYATHPRRRLNVKQRDSDRREHTRNKSLIAWCRITMDQSLSLEN